MKNRTLIIMLSVLICCIVCLQCINPISAHSIEHEKYLNDNLEIVDIINSYSPKKNVEYSISSFRKLRSLSSGLSEYTIYQLSPCGYVVLDDLTGCLLEGCYSENAFSIVEPIFEIMDSDNIYYGAPQLFLLNDNGSKIDILRNTVLSSEEYAEVCETEENYRNCRLQILNSELAQTQNQGNSSKSTNISITIEYDYFFGLDDFGFNQYGTCTVVASQILFGYFDEFINDGFVDSAYEVDDGTSDAFHQHLNGYVYGSGTPGGIFIHDAIDGLNDYLLSRPVCATIDSEYSSQSNAISKIIQELSDWRPVIASMGKTYGADKNHTVVIYGVQHDYIRPLTAAVFTTHYGWLTQLDHNDFLVSAAWFYECGFVEYNSSHSYSSWIYHNNLKHKKICSDCGQTMYASHTFSLIGGVRICTGCGYVFGGLANSPRSSLQRRLTYEESYI